jgi:hypothetical protein
MYVKQISIFLENRAGRLEEITLVLAEGNINIRALSLADTSDFGILRLIVNQPEEAMTLLRNAGFTVRENSVFAVEVDDQPGGLHQILQLFGAAGISIEYMYAFFEKKSGKAVIIIRVENTDQAINALKDGKIPLLSSKEVYKL